MKFALIIAIQVKMIDFVFEIVGLYAQFLAREKNLETALVLTKTMNFCWISLSQVVEKASRWKLLWKLTCSSWFDSVCCCNMIAGIVNILKNWSLCWIKLKTISTEHSFCNLKKWYHICAKHTKENARIQFPRDMLGETDSCDHQKF